MTADFLAFCLAVAAGADRVGRGVRVGRRRPGRGRAGQSRRVAPEEVRRPGRPTAPRSRSTPGRSKGPSPSRPEEAEYERIRPTYADTAAAQWELAQWCREHKLEAAARGASAPGDRAGSRPRRGPPRPGLQPGRRPVDHARRSDDQARLRAIQGPVEVRRRKSKSLENKRKLEAAQQEWCQKVKRWRGWLGTDRDQQARENIRAIDDPGGGQGVGGRDCTTTRDPHVRLLFIEALAKIDTPEAAMALAIASIYDAVEEVRLTCLDHLQTKKRPEVIAYYVGKLKDKRQRRGQPGGRRAGPDERPVGHRPADRRPGHGPQVQDRQPGGDNSMSAEFRRRSRRRGTGMSVGGRPTYHPQVDSQPGRARRPGRPDRQELQLRQAGLEILVRRPEEVAGRDRRQAGLGLEPSGPPLHSRGWFRGPWKSSTPWLISSHSRVPVGTAAPKREGQRNGRKKGLSGPRNSCGSGGRSLRAGCSLVYGRSIRSICQTVAGGPAAQTFGHQPRMAEGLATFCLFVSSTRLFSPCPPLSQPCSLLHSQTS